MIIVKEATTKKQMREFASFPLKLYKGNKYVCPPFYGDEKNLLNAKKNMYSDFTDTKCFLAYKDGKLAGRLAVIINHLYIEKWNDKCARFSRFDVIDDLDVTKALFEAGEKYARECGMERINGPMGYVDQDREGLLIEGFEEYQTYGGSYNYEYYARHIEALGFKKQVDWLERKLFIPEQKPEKIVKVAEILKKKYELRETIDNNANVKKLVAKEKDRIFDLLNTCYAHLHGTVPFNQRVIDNLVAQILLVIKAEYISLVEDKEGNLIGFGLVFPPLWHALNKCGGKLNPKGIFNLLKAVKSKHDTVEMILIAVAPEWQKRGVPAIVMDRILGNLIENGVKYAETNGTLEDNVMINNQWDGFEHVKHKRKRCYVKEL